jgi:hypothetical protein
MNKKFSAFFILFFVFFGNDLFAQKSRHFWFTYGHTKFVMSPGFETALFFHENIGFNLGFGTYLQLLNKERIANQLYSSNFFFYNFNMGPSTEFKINEKHSLGAGVGVIIYYGPDYKFLHHYVDGDYDIYFDASNKFRPDMGADFSIFYAYNRMSALVKFDVARKNWHVGYGAKLEKKEKNKNLEPIEQL